MRVTVLAGGIGAARFLAGMQHVVPPEDLTAICNVGDDLEWLGLTVCPDIDSVLYTLAGIEGSEGWGVRDDTRHALEALRALGGESWFSIGDIDLATHLFRTERMREGSTLAEATAALALARGVGVRVIPVTNDPHPTIVRTADGDLAFQDYFVRQRAQPTILGVDFPGAALAKPAPAVVDAIVNCDLLCIAPSNPIVSISPLLAIPDVRAAVKESRARRVAISPIVGGEAIKGPAAAMLKALGHEVSAFGVARLYAGLIDTFVLDAVDARLTHDVSALGMDAVAVDTMMRGDEGRERVARNVVRAAGFPA
ncbi:MAG: 2-phospho-L-lactate transferase [Chloroflexi bacterium]|nr:MAG: 2-phospho-L-lactate transferase [Chloroflexota bacterium]